MVSEGRTFRNASHVVLSHHGQLNVCGANDEIDARTECEPDGPADGIADGAATEVELPAVSLFVVAKGSFGS